MPRLLVNLAVLFVLVATAQFARADVDIQVFAGKHDRTGTPVSVKLSRSLAQYRHFALTRIDNDKNVPVQVTSGKTPQITWLIGETLSAGQSRRYRLSPAEKPAKPSHGVEVKDDGKSLRISVAGKPVLVYNTAVVRSPNRKEAYYDRSGYIHPLYNPRGQIVTDDFAPDHPHQHGMMFPWTNTSFEGRAVNFWDQQKGKGKIAHGSIKASGGGSVFGEFIVRLNHFDTTNPDKPKPVLSEIWQMRVYNLADYFLFDLKSKQECVGNPLQIEKYHYGGFAIRGHRNWLTPGQGDFLTSEGKTRKDGNHTRPRWVDIHGNIDGAMAGVTIFC
ncbi:MAG: PmoA family protein, partial [Planctomycetes bacterium]|nr:PmoA family protein [Planctomycetota bacterium]